MDNQIFGFIKRQAMEWFRLYSDILNDPKVMLLEKDSRWDYVTVLCIASENNPRGFLPDDEQVAFKMRVSKEEWKKIKEIFIQRDFLIINNGMLQVHGWDNRQFESDDAATRAKKYRESRLDSTNQSMNNDAMFIDQSANNDITFTECSSNVQKTTVSRAHNRTDTEQIQNRTEKENATNVASPLFKSKKRKTVDATSVSLEIIDCCKLWKRKMMENMPDIFERLKENYREEWIDVFDKLLNLDKCPRDEVLQLIDFCFDKERSWWAQTRNIRSPTKLRKRNKEGIYYYDIILDQMRQLTKGQEEEIPSFSDGDGVG